MKKLFTGILFLFFTTAVIAQGLSTKGYIIKKDGTKLNGYIERMSISENPMYVGFAAEKKATDFNKIPLSEIELVSPKGKREYLIAEVEIDNTSNDLGKLEDGNRYPEFDVAPRLLYLEIIVKGDATLYRSYLDATEKFFYKAKPEAKIEQLFYKKYFLPRDVFYLGNETVKENKEYLRQLNLHVPCFNKKRRMLYPEYTKLSLKSHFKKYNAGKCYN
tara:strand:- start:147302 stop:147955 length:654 start_codon:yes stop_codon:yes gene_type:complete